MPRRVGRTAGRGLAAPLDRALAAPRPALLRRRRAFAAPLGRLGCAARPGLAAPLDRPWLRPPAAAAAPRPGRTGRLLGRPAAGRLAGGPASRWVCSSDAARSGVTFSGVSPARVDSVALVSPSVTYGPKRPSFTTIGLPLTGSGPSSRSGGLGHRPPAPLGLGEDRQRLVEADSEQLVLRRERPAVVPLLEIRPEPPVLRGDLLAVGGVDADDPRATTAARAPRRGSPVSGSIVLNSEARRRLLLRPLLLLAQPARRRRTVRCARSPPSRSPGRSRGHAAPAARRAAPPPSRGVSSSGARSSGSDARSSPRWRYGPYRPTRTTMSVGDRDRVDVAGVDLVEVVRDERLQTTGRHAVAEVEVAQPRHPLLGTVGDLVEVVLEPGGEGVVDEVREVALEQRHDGERGPRRHQRRPLLPHVPAVLDGPDDRGVGRRPAHAEILERLDQGGLGVAGRRCRRVRLRLELERDEHVADRERGQRPLLVLELGIGIVGALDVGPQEPRE